MPVLVPTLLSVRVAMSGRETNNNMRMEMRICRPVCSRFSDSTTATHGKFFHIFPIFNITKQSATGPEGPTIAGTHAGPSSCRSGWTWSALAGGLDYAGGPKVVVVVVKRERGVLFCWKIDPRTSPFSKDQPQDSQGWCRTTSRVSVVSGAGRQAAEYR